MELRVHLAIQGQAVLLELQAKAEHQALVEYRALAVRPGSAEFLASQVIQESAVHLAIADYPVFPVQVVIPEQAVHLHFQEHLVHPGLAAHQAIAAIQGFQARMAKPQPVALVDIREPVEPQAFQGPAGHQEPAELPVQVVRLEHLAILELQAKAEHLGQADILASRALVGYLVSAGHPVRLVSPVHQEPVEHLESAASPALLARVGLQVSVVILELLGRVDTPALPA